MSYFDDNEDRITGIKGGSYQGIERKTKMAEYDNTNKGALFLNDKKGKEKAPDRKGTLNVNGQEFWISGWLKTSKAGNQFLSLSVQPKEAQEAQDEQTQQPDDVDQIPF